MSTVHIVFDPSDLEDCKRALDEMVHMISGSHGPTQAQLLFSKAAVTKRFIKKNRNVSLLIKHMNSGLSMNQSAVKIAEANELSRRKGRGPDDWYGPNGSTSPKTVEKQIDREMKRMARDPRYRKAVEWLAEAYRARDRALARIEEQKNK